MENSGITIEQAIVPEIAEIVEKQIDLIRPVVIAHGGGAEILKANSEEVVIGIKGHCAGCPIAPITFGKILDKYIRRALPDIKKVSYEEIN